MDVNKAIRLAVDTGKVEFGRRNSIRNALSGKARLVIIARNCPKSFRENVLNYSKTSGVNVYNFSGSSLELGSLCGKPFPVAMMSIIDQGNSNVLEISK